MGNTGGNAGNGGFRVRQGQEQQVDGVPLRLPLGNHMGVDTARQGGFKAEALALGNQLVNLPEHKPSGLDCLALWRKGRQAGGNKVGVDELGDVSRRGDKTPSEDGSDYFGKQVGSEKGAFFMPDDKKNTVQPSAQNALDIKKCMEALARAIRDEMGSLTQEELERLYAMVVFMTDQQDN